MTLKFNLSERAVGFAAAAVLAAAVAFAAAALANSALAALLAPLAFCLAYAGLGQVDEERAHRLAGFELQAVDWPRRSPEAMDDGDKVIRLFPRAAPTCADGAADDAGQALSDALAELKRSLR